MRRTRHTKRKPVASTLRIDGTTLTLDGFERAVLSNPPRPVRLDRVAARRMKRPVEVIGNIVRDDRIVYGVSMGFGRLADIRIHPRERRNLQRNLIMSHAAGVGPPCTRSEVRGMMLLRLNLLAKGHSGVRPLVAERLIDFLNSDICPVVPRRGSVGASGDLAPMAHIGLAIIGEGEVALCGPRMSTRRALAHLGLKPIPLEAKEGLALINGVQASTAVLRC